MQYVYESTKQTVTVVIFKGKIGYMTLQFHDVSYGTSKFHVFAQRHYKNDQYNIISGLKRREKASENTILPFRPPSFGCLLPFPPRAPLACLATALHRAAPSLSKLEHLLGTRLRTPTSFPSPCHQSSGSSSSPLFTATAFNSPSRPTR